MVKQLKKELETCSDEEARVLIQMEVSKSGDGETTDGGDFDDYSWSLNGNLEMLMTKWQQNRLQERLEQRKLDLEWDLYIAEHKRDNDKDTLMSSIRDLEQILVASGSSRADELFVRDAFKHNYIFSSGDQTVFRVEFFKKHNRIMRCEDPDMRSGSACFKAI